MSKPLDIEQLRMFAGDAAADLPNKLAGDHTFTDEALLAALESGARAYNSVPPFGVHTVNVNSMQTSTNLFFNACCAMLFRRHVAMLSQQAVNVQAGNTVSDPDSIVRAELMKLADRMYDEFQQEARHYKGTLNMNRFYGRCT